MEKTNHGNPDAVRNAIPSHNTMLISLPREVAMRAGIKKGVQVRVGQSLETPTIITMEVINPMDLSSELKAYLDAEKAAAANRVEAAERKAAFAELTIERAKKREAKSVAVALRLKEAAEKAAEKAEKALAKAAKPKAKPKVAKAAKPKKPAEETAETAVVPEETPESEPAV